jgi:hypothetical protein
LPVALAREAAPMMTMAAALILLLLTGRIFLYGI